MIAMIACFHMSLVRRAVRAVHTGKEFLTYGSIFGRPRGERVEFCQRHATKNHSERLPNERWRRDFATPTWPTTAAAKRPDPRIAVPGS